jgi:hypothetical protein
VLDLRFDHRQRGIGERGQAQPGITQAFEGAADLRMRRQLADRAQDPLLVLVREDAEPGLAAETLDQIKAWAGSALGIDHVPAVWRVLARQPRFLAATWAKNCLVLGAGELDEATKACTALAVAMNARSGYLTSYLTPWVRRAAGLDDGGLVELGAAVMHYVSFNTVAHGMMLDPPFVDVRAEDFRPGGRLADAPGPGAPPSSR